MDVSSKTKSFRSGRVEHFTESVIRDMTRQALQHGAINLSQGFPDFPASRVVKEAAQEAIAGDINQYAITWGAKKLRDAIARKFKATRGVTVDPETFDVFVDGVLATCEPAREVPLARRYMLR